jgi:uncharacterized membrane protein YeaQ/YmgE (transglycosylase-associated protein family)
VLFALLVLCVVLFVVVPVFVSTVMSAVWAVIVGLVLGFVARAIAPGKGKIGLVATALVGIAGGLLGRIAARATHSGSFAQLLLEVLAAALLVLVVRTFQGTAA